MIASNFNASQDQPKKLPFEGIDPFFDCKIRHIGAEFFLSRVQILILT